MRLLFLLGVSVFAASMLACSSSDSSGSEANQPAQTTSGACATETRKDVYAPGLTKSAGPLSVKLLDSQPGPPIKGVNTMNVEVTDASGAPVDGAKITVQPWMPDHAHGSSVVPGVAPAGGGKYTVSNVYFIMAGLWQVKVDVTVGAAQAQEAIFSFCLDG